MFLDLLDDGLQHILHDVLSAMLQGISHTMLPLANMVYEIKALIQAFWTEILEILINHNLRLFQLKGKVFRGLENPLNFRNCQKKITFRNKLFANF